MGRICVVRFRDLRSSTVERLLLIIALTIKSVEAPAQQSQNTWFDLNDEPGRVTLGQLRARLERYGVAYRFLCSSSALRLACAAHSLVSMSGRHDNSLIM